jgi:phospholipid/cholesterol/gamma-HCH transport system substrate-binding protein
LRRIDGILNQNEKPLNAAISGIAAFADMLGRNAPRVEGLIGGLERLTGGGTPAAGPTVYDLTPATDFPPSEKTLKAQLVVPDPNALILFDSQKILTRSGAGTYGNIANAQWADNLPKLVQARIVQSFENARQINMVSRPFDTLNPAYRLETTIRSFQIAPEPTPQAVIEVTARLVSEKGDVAAARVFSASAPAKSAEALDAVAAINDAFKKVAGEMVTWAMNAI